MYIAINQRCFRKHTTTSRNQCYPRHCVRLKGTISKLIPPDSPTSKWSSVQLFVLLLHWYFLCHWCFCLCWKSHPWFCFSLFCQSLQKKIQMQQGAQDAWTTQACFHVIFCLFWGVKCIKTGSGWFFFYRCHFDVLGMLMIQGGPGGLSWSNILLFVFIIINIRTIQALVALDFTKMMDIA